MIMLAYQNQWEKEGTMSKKKWRIGKEYFRVHNLFENDKKSRLGINLLHLLAESI